MRKIIILVAVAFNAMSVSALAAEPPLRLGFFDSVFAASTSERDPWLTRAASEGADFIRLDIGWPALSRPTDPTNPRDSAYGFAPADDKIKAAVAHGLTPLVGFTGAPSWAEGAGRPSNVTPGTWDPGPSALRAYGTALARRYSGTFPDPAEPGKTLPRVKYFQVWNEPNLDKYLNPQWTKVSGRWVATGPAIYRGMLNAFYAGVKSVRKDDMVVTAGTGPFGDPQPGGNRIMPLRFWRNVLAKPTHFDILDHHPYGVRDPTSPALNADDITVPDMGKLRKLMDQKGYKQPIWATEFSYDSDPPDPQGVPAAQHARWLSEGFYEMWHAGVSAIFWFQIRDQAPIPSYAATSQSGTYLLNGTPKPAATAFRFPFVAIPKTGKTVTIWARAPKAGRLAAQRRTGSTWLTVETVTVKRHEVVLLTVPGSRKTTFRARVGSSTSLTFAASQFGK